MSSPGSFRALPAIGRLLDHDALAGAISRHGRPLVTTLLREIVEELRSKVGDTGASIPSELELSRLVDRRAEALLAPSPRRVINATGVIAHTNLGRSVLSAAAAARVAEAATGYVDLEYDVAKGKRGDRMSHLTGLFDRLFPGYAALAVNNNAAATFLALRALAKGKEVVVSRGELVEIGGSFRIPDVLAASGAKLREVGTTNRTRAADYESAAGSKTGALLKVHTSNFKVVGFTEDAGIEELAAIAKAKGVPLIVDWGSGDLAELEALGVKDETPVATILAQGADVVTFSGDKLLGGPQAGIAVGREDLIKKMRKDPMARVLRLDRLQIAALRETLASYVTGRALEEVPTLRMLAIPADAIAQRAETVAKAAQAGAPGLRFTIEPGVSRPGGGSSPVGEVPTMLLAIDDPSGDAGKLEARLRRGDPPIVARVQDGRLLLDLRTVLPEQDEVLSRALAVAHTRG
jgi:L-seryl-tRNA(Ser) seleniumtransferase